MERKISKNMAVDWQSNKQTLKERIEHLLNHGLWSDCKFLVGIEPPNIKEFDAHKLILSASSAVFATMFNGGLPETQSPIKIIDVQPEAFKSMLQYVYCDEINIESLDQACELCYVAKKYMLPDLLKSCMQFIWKDVDASTAVRAYEFAKLFDDVDILGKSMKIISEKTMEILSAPGLLAINSNTLQDIYDQNYLDIPSELHLFTALQTWLLFNFKNETDEELRKKAKPILQKIRFLAMDASEFADGPAQSQLLTRDESFSILMNISSPGIKYPIPNGFSKCRECRLNPMQHEISSIKKMYIRRQTKDSSIQLNNFTLRDSLVFTVSEDITLLGIQILSQIAHVSEDNSDLQRSLITANGNGTFNENRLLPAEAVNNSNNGKYKELLMMHVKQLNDPDLPFQNTWFTHFTTLVEYNSLMNVMFKKPINIKKGQDYELSVTLSKEGYYFVGSSDRIEEKYSDEIKFIISGTTDVAFVNALVFNR